jgi:hypothetical protein
MSTRIKLLAVAILLAPLAPIGAAADTAKPAAAVEGMCDYCADYTDAAMVSGPVQSAYQPVVGYAVTQAAATEPSRTHEINLFRIDTK